MNAKHEKRARDRCTYREFAEQLGVPYGTIKRWVLEGMPTLRNAARGPRIPVTAALVWVHDHRSGSIAFSRESLVYVLRRQSDGAVKIGWTSDFIRRFSELQTDVKENLSIVAVMTGSKTAELALHKKFVTARLDGEWFDSSDDLVAAFLASLCWDKVGTSERQILSATSATGSDAA